MLLRILLLFVLLAGPAWGQADIRYYVRDDIKTPMLEYTIDRDCVVYSWGTPPDLPNLQYHVTITVYGCKQKAFTYEEQHYNQNFSLKEYDELSRMVKSVDLTKFRDTHSTSCQFGWLVIEGKTNTFDNPLGDPARDKLQAAILAFLDKAVPRSKRTLTTHTLESDLTPPRAVTIKEILASPAKFDGKRVRVTGYYHSEDDESNLSDQKGADEKQSVWLSGDSTFSPTGNWIDDGNVTVEGTFLSGPGGHWGGWPGEIQRVTQFISLDPPPPPRPPADQSSKR